jgi:hypothetical protein
LHRADACKEDVDWLWMHCSHQGIDDVSEMMMAGSDFADPLGEIDRALAS